MARRHRIAPGGFVYHVMNRAAGRLVLFEPPSDYTAFERLMSRAQRRIDMRILAYCLMPNHWHLLLWPERDRALSRFMHWLETIHTSHWKLERERTGRGAVYQSRFKSIPVQTDDHLLTVWRYVERNPLRANLVASADLWRWSSLAKNRDPYGPTLAISPCALPPDWRAYVNRPQTDAELEAVRSAIRNGEPFGDVDWRATTRATIGWRRRGRPKKGVRPLFPDEKGVRPLFQP